MSYIPNTREKRKYSFKTGRYDGEENGYRQEYLNEEDDAFRRGYDYAVETVLNYFNNLDAFSDAFLEAELNLDRVDTDAVVSDCLTEDEVKNLSRDTLILGTVHDTLADWLEMERNQFIVSLIDGMDDKEYEAIKEAVLKREEQENGA